MFGNPFIARVIASVFQRADNIVRREFIGEDEIIETNERDRVSSLGSMIRRNPFMRVFPMQSRVHGRDTHARDGLFVFRYRDKIKVGIFESKLLYIDGVADLNRVWDQPDPGTQRSRFTRQVVAQQEWVNQFAVWDMFWPNCPEENHSPSLSKKGSSCIWATDMFNQPNIANPTTLWSFNDVKNATPQYMSLYDVVYNIIMCNQGILHDIEGAERTVAVRSANGRLMDIPIPRRLWGNQFRNDIEKFFERNENFSTFTYYRFDDLYRVSNSFELDQELNIEEILGSDKRIDPKELTDFYSILQNSLKD